MADQWIHIKVDKGGDDGDAILGLIIIVALIGIYQVFFADYDDNDFNTAKYFDRAKSGAQELVLEWQGRNWRPRGFTDEFQVLSNEPEFKTTIINTGNQPATQYLGHGVFQVAVETSTLLKSKSGKTVTVQEGFIVQIQSDKSHGWLYRVFKGDDWRFVVAEQAYMSPTLPEINNLIAQWSLPKR